MYSKIKNLYDEFSKKYDEYALSKGEYNAHLLLSSKLFELNALPKNAKILDLGCGTGLSGEPFLKKRCEVTGVDVSAKMLELAKNKGYEQVFEEDVERINKLSLKEFDVAVMLGVMEFVEKPEKLFLKIKELLKPKGFFLLTIPTKLNKKSMLKHKNYTKKETYELIKKTNYKIIYYEKNFGYNSRHSKEKIYYHYFILNKK
ncbi:MAG: class I SAM-dependent DNA methyltransferase [Candidatus Woesearchaeota archaeon]